MHGQNGTFRLIDCATAETMLRLVQSVLTSHNLHGHITKPS